MERNPLAQDDPRVRRERIDRVERALARERRKARVRHWSYSLNRHLALREELDRLRGCPRRPFGRRGRR